MEAKDWGSETERPTRPTKGIRSLLLSLLRTLSGRYAVASLQPLSRGSSSLQESSTLQEFHFVPNKNEYKDGLACIFSHLFQDRSH